MRLVAHWGQPSWIPQCSIYGQVLFNVFINNLHTGKECTLNVYINVCNNTKPGGH